jgi:amino acid adenylation domain-containing protein
MTATPDKPARKRHDSLATESCLDTTAMDVVDSIGLFATRHPEAPAIHVDGRTWSCGELWNAVVQIEQLVLSSGSDIRRPVALLIGKNERLIAAMVAVVRSGRFFVVVDPGLPERRNRLVLKDADPSLVIHDGHSPLLPEGVAALQLPTMEHLCVSAHASHVTHANSDPSSLACLLYTSGSTGTPKGVMLSRAGLNAVAMVRNMGIIEGARVSVLGSMAVLGGLRTVFGGLSVGAILCPFELERDGLDKLRLWLRDVRVEVLHTTPSILRHFARTVPEGERTETVRTVILVAERAVAGDADIARRIFSAKVSVWSGLGSSEAGTITGRMIAPDEVLPEGQIELGPTVPGRKIRLVREDGLPAAIGETGELIVEGADLGLGYWRQEDRTAALFAQGSGAGWRQLRTGDLGRILADGSLHHMGRKDSVIKIRGVRVDLGEVEAVVARHAAVHECVVAAVASADGDVRLVAFVQFQGPAAIDALRDQVDSVLPPAMRPQQYVVVKDWPRTSTGKLDRNALRPPEEVPDQSHDLQGDVERAIGLIWSEVLERPIQVRNTHFLEAGGNSLSAMRVTMRVARDCGKHVSPAALLTAPRLHDFAALVQAAALVPRAATTLQPSGNELGPLSPAQEALWILEQLEGSSATYNVTLALRLTGPLDVDRLSTALHDLQRRHEALRIVIREADDMPVQQILPPSTLPQQQGSGLSAEPLEGGLDLEQVLRIEAQRPVAITAEHLWRSRLIRVSPEDHALILVLHHVICDGWSLQVLAEDLGALYSGTATADPGAGTRFIDVAARQRAHPQSGEGLASRKYWASMLAGLSNIELPTDRPQSGLVSPAGAIERFAIPGSVTAALRAFSSRELVTPFTVQVAAFQLLLARYTGALDFAVGVPAADRPDGELERVVGYMVNTLALRASLTDSITFRELVSQAAVRLVGALAHQDVAFEQLVEDLAPVREGNRNPLFQVAFAVQNLPRGDLHFEGLQVRRLETHNGASKFDLTLEISDSDHGPRGEIEYRTALFDRETISRMARHYVRLLDAALEFPDTPILSLTMLDEHELHTLLQEWNATTVARPIGLKLDRLVLDQCRRSPDAVAISWNHSTLSYAELADEVATSAAVLRAGGVGPGDTVGVLLRRSQTSIVSATAIMHVGGTYLPMDPDWPEQRIRTVAAAAGARYVLRDEGMQALLDGTSQGEARTDDGLAYVLFTSGSTGAPKGVEIAHESICNHLLWFNECTGMNASDVMLFKTAPTFDASLVEMFAPLVAGARVVIARDQGELDAEYITRMAWEGAITILQAVPSAYRTLLAVGGLSHCTSLRYLVIGGEALDRDLALSLKQVLPNAQMGNFYGPTEVTIDATQHEITDWEEAVVPIGRPVANARCYVLDALGQPQPPGVWGELFVGGVGVARGYRNRPELTATSFRPDPFNAGMRMYGTGDRVRWRNSGTLEYSGRRDGQVKIRGLRIELGEIEAALLQKQGVAHAVVMAVAKGKSAGPALLAFVVATRGSDLDAIALRDALALQLPRYMIPNQIVLCDSLPLLPSGKIDRTELLRDHEAAARTESLAPRTLLEKGLLDLWQEHLGVPRCGVDDDFFELGGHSLLAFQLAGGIQKRLERPCTLRMLFRFPTVRQLAQALEANSKSTRGSIVLPLQGNGTRPPIYCICGVQLYRELAQQFAPDIPVHGVFLPWEEQLLDASRRPTELTVEEMAGRYIQAIRTEHPRGTFSLVGISFGGILAFEIARQMAAAGEDVPVVAVLDMPPVEARRRPRPTPWYLYGQLAIWLRIRFNRLFADRLDADTLHAHLMEERDVMYDQAMQKYRTPPYTGRLVVVRASRRRPGGASADPALGWRTYVANVSAVDAPGDHLGILQKQGAEIIAEAMRQWLP